MDLSVKSELSTFRTVFQDKSSRHTADREDGYLLEIFPFKRKYWMYEWNSHKNEIKDVCSITKEPFQILYRFNNWKIPLWLRLGSDYELLMWFPCPSRFFELRVVGKVFCYISKDR